MTSRTERLVTVVLTVSNLDQAVKLYSDGFGLHFHFDDHEGGEPWISGRHAATSWTDGAFMHFALYQSKDGATTTGAQIAFRVSDLESAHQAAGAAGAVADGAVVSVTGAGVPSGAAGAVASAGAAASGAVAGAAGADRPKVVRRLVSERLLLSVAHSMMNSAPCGPST